MKFLVVLVVVMAAIYFGWPYIFEGRHLDNGILLAIAAGATILLGIGFLIPSRKA